MADDEYDDKLPPHEEEQKVDEKDLGDPQEQARLASERHDREMRGDISGGEAQGPSLWQKMKDAGSDDKRGSGDPQDQGYEASMAARGMATPTPPVAPAVPPSMAAVQAPPQAQNSVPSAAPAPAQATPEGARKLVATHLRQKGLHALANAVDPIGADSRDAAANEDAIAPGPAGAPVAQASASQGPSIADRMRQKAAADDAEMKAAQAQTGQNGIAKFLMTMAGGSDAQMKALDAADMKPVTDLMARRGASAKTVEDQTKALQAMRQADLSDPTSRESKVVQALAVRAGVDPSIVGGLTGNDMDVVKAGQTDQERRDALAERAENNQREREQAKVNSDETRREHDLQHQDRRAALNAKDAKSKDIPPNVSTQVGASANSAKMIDELDAAHEQAMQSNNPADWKKYNDLVETYAPSVAAGLNRTGVARGELTKEVAKNLHSGVLTGASDKVFGTGFVKNKLNGYKTEAESRGREAIDSIDPSRFDTTQLEAQHAKAFGPKPAPAAAGVRIKLSNGQVQTFPPDKAAEVIRRKLGVAVGG